MPRAVARGGFGAALGVASLIVICKLARLRLWPPDFIFCIMPYILALRCRASAACAAAVAHGAAAPAAACLSALPVFVYCAVSAARAEVRMRVGGVVAVTTRAWGAVSQVAAWWPRGTRLWARCVLRAPTPLQLSLGAAVRGARARFRCSCAWGRQRRPRRRAQPACAA